MSLQSTLDRISAGQRLGFRDDGAVFRNREGLLPPEPVGYWHEYVDPTPGQGGPGARRVVTGQGGEIYYTTDHYQSFTREAGA